MHDRLAKLLLASPPADTSWTGPPPEWRHPMIRRCDGRQVEIDLPLFWYDPPWYRLPTDRANAVAVAVARLGIVVSAMRSDVASSNDPSSFHDETIGENEPHDDGSRRALPRIVPYRPERYGLVDRDFDGARIIDVRLTMHRDESGRFAYAASQIERWESTPSGHPASGGSWVPSATFPPDLPSIQHLGTKLDQLRMLSPNAAVFVSIGPWRLEKELVAVAASQPDGVILRLDELASDEGDAISLAVLTQHARKLLDRVGSPQTPLWIVPGAISVADAAKLVALGASAVAIDRWCDDLWLGANSQDRSAAARLGYSSASSTSSSFLSQLAGEELQPLLSQFTGLLNSLQLMPPDQQLASLDQQWCEQLGLQLQIMPSLNR